MAPQLSPAWQRRPVSSGHLAEISDRFLSDEAPAEHGTGDCQVIPFLLDTPDQRWVVEGLGEIFAQRGRRNVLCEPSEDEAGASQPDIDAALAQCPPDAPLRLLPANSPATIQAGHFDHVVLPVPANLDSLLHAYRRIKLLSGRTPLNVGIIVVGPRDQHAAWRYFRKLAVGTLRYLDVALLNLGFVPYQVTPEGGEADHHRHNYLTRISERLLRSEFYSRCPADTEEATR